MQKAVQDVCLDEKLSEGLNVGGLAYQMPFSIVT